MTANASLLLSWRQRQYLTALILVLWTLAIVASVVWNGRLLYSAMLEGATQDARNSFNKDLLYRRWATAHGGVYVPVTDLTPPNPYLTDVFERDIVTPSGRRLTLLNPAYMMRQVYELGTQYESRAHITSLKPIRSENAPDAWEVAALRAFAKGKTEVLSIESFYGEQQLRFMKPMVAEAGCLKCHASQGYKVGDVRGGISVAVPLAKYFAVARSRLWPIAGVHAGLWAVGVLGILGASRQIRQRIEKQLQTEQTLRESEQRYRSYFELPLVGLAITSPEKGWLEVNDRLCAMLGYSRAELLGMTWAELTAPADLTADVAQFEHLMAGAIESYQLEKRFVHKDGQFIHTELAVQCIRTATGAVDYIVALIQDISKRKRALAELQQAQQQLIEQERLRVVGQLAAGIAHDFNNTLAPIVGFSELLLKDPAKRADPALLVQWLQFINTAATDAASVVRQIRELSHVPTPAALQVPVDLNQLIQQIIASTQPRWKDQAQGEGCTLNIVAQCGPIPLVTGEEYALREAVTNLLFNAVDFTPNGGTITLGTAVAGEFVRCWVSDTGVGMTEETRQHCLEPFFTTKGPQGTGLGLAMVQSIVQRYGGTVAIASVLGRGTTVTLRLPIPSVQAAIPARAAAPPVPRVLRVLVVDDEPLLCILVEAWLKIDGHSVATVSSGPAALQRLQTDPFDLVITDKAMPDMNGEQLAVAIHESTPGLPVILMTGFGDLMKAAGKMPPHIRVILSKPITGESLREALAEVFPTEGTDQRGGGAENSQ